jgi:hypothetical protein
MIAKVKIEFTDETVLISNKNVQDSSGNWEPRLLSVSNYTHSLWRDFRPSTIEMLVADDDGDFRARMITGYQYIVGKDVTTYDDSDNVLFKGVIASWKYPSRYRISISLSDIEYGFKDVIPGNYIKTTAIDDYDTDTLFPNADSEAVGKPIPIIYGAPGATEGATKAYKVTADRYLIGDVDPGTSLNEIWEDVTDGGGDRQLVNSANYDEVTSGGLLFISYPTGTVSKVYANFTLAT